MSGGATVVAPAAVLLGGNVVVGASVDEDASVGTVRVYNATGP